MATIRAASKTKVGKKEMIALPPLILELKERFDQNHQAYHSDPYNETYLPRPIY
jgi:hypothetical protein